jgi:hypothetical protein
MNRQKGYELLRDLAMREIVDVIRKKGAASASEICEATGRSRGNVDGYLKQLEGGRHVVRGLPPVAARKGTTFLYTAIVGEVVELGASEPSDSVVLRDQVGNLLAEGRFPKQDDLGLTRCEKHGTLRDAAQEPCWQCWNESTTTAATDGELRPSLDLTATEQRAQAHRAASHLVQARLLGLPLSDDETRALPSAVVAVREAYGSIPLNPEGLDDDELLRRIRAGELTVTGRFPSQPEQQVTQVVRASRSGPIPAHPSAYQQQIQGTPVGYSSADLGENLIECRPCSEAGGAEHGVLHEPPACKPNPGLPSPSVEAPFVGLKAAQAGLGDEPPRAPDREQVLARARARRSNPENWVSGFTHLTKGGEFDLLDWGDGRTSVRRTNGSGPAVILATADVLGMFIPASKADGTLDTSPRLDPPYAGQEKRPKPAAPGPMRQPSGDVWITPKPPEAQPPLTSRSITSGADDLGHWGQGSKPDTTTDAGDGEGADE